jgi:hypothetical protein
MPRKGECSEIMQRQPTTEEIAARAYQIYLERGRTNGHDVDDWMQAEYELMQLPVRMLAELEPPKAARGNGKARSKSIIELVQTAMY